MTYSPAQLAVKNWLNDIVIGHNFCPFAKQPALQDKVRFVEQGSKKQAGILEGLIDECQFLDAHKDVETSLLIITHACADFYQY